MKHDKATGAPIWNVANYLTIARVLAIPLVIALMMLVEPETRHQTWFSLQPAQPLGHNFIYCLAAAIIFAAASITDYLDGYLARRLKLETNLGKLLDPLADKLLVIGAMIMLVEMSRLPGWMALVVISREIGITALRGIATDQGVVISASKLGKWKTATTLPALVALILYYDFPLFVFIDVNCFAVGAILFMFAVVLTVWSGLDYFFRFWKLVVE